MYAVIGVIIRKDKTRKQGFLDALDCAVTGVRYYDYINNKVCYCAVSDISETMAYNFINVCEVNTVFNKPMRTVVEYPLSRIPQVNRANKVCANKLIVCVKIINNQEALCVLPDDSIVTYSLATFKELENKGMAYSVVIRNTAVCRDKTKLYAYESFNMLTREQSMVMYKLQTGLRQYKHKSETLGIMEEIRLKYLEDFVRTWWKGNKDIIKQILSKNSLCITSDFDIILMTYSMQNIPAMFITGLDRYKQATPVMLIVGKGMTCDSYDWFGKFTVNTVFLPTSYKADSDVLSRLQFGKLIIGDSRNGGLKKVPCKNIFVPPLGVQWSSEWQVEPEGVVNA